MAYLEYGEGKKNSFTLWLDRFARLELVGLSSEELWEHRNALLHTSTFESRKVKASTCRELAPFVGRIPDRFKFSDPNVHHYDLVRLIHVTAEAVEAWLNCLNEDRNQIVKFVERYDLIASDARQMSFDYSSL